MDDDDDDDDEPSSTSGHSPKVLRGIISAILATRVKRGTTGHGFHAPAAVFFGVHRECFLFTNTALLCAVLP